MFGVGEIFQWLGQAQANLPGWGHCEGQVAERFIAGAVGGDPVTRAIPSLAPLRHCQVCRGQIVSGLGQSFTAFGDVHDAGIGVGVYPSQLGTHRLQSALLGKPLCLARVSLDRPLAGFALLACEGFRGWLCQPVLDRRDRGPQTDDVPVLRVTGQPVLLVVGADDRIGPPGTRCRREPALARVQSVPASLPLGSRVQARVNGLRSRHRSQVGAAQLAQMRCHRIQHPLVSFACLQPGSDRHTARTGHRLNPTPLTQLHCRHAASPKRASAVTTARSRAAACRFDLLICLQLPTGSDNNGQQIR
jgi:hypothetical protein